MHVYFVGCFGYFPVWLRGQESKRKESILLIRKYVFHFDFQKAFKAEYLTILYHFVVFCHCLFMQPVQNKQPSEIAYI